MNKEWIKDTKTLNGGNWVSDPILAKPFKMIHSFNDRIAESKRVANLHANKIPVICEKSPRSKIPQLKKRTYLIPLDMTIGHFMYLIRKHLKATSEQSLYLYVGGRKMYSNSTCISHIYDKEKDSDGFLYIVYNYENTFG
jgi:GABA(A) receptor-associated protein